ncbi:sigma-54-dependent Fis family transcriptional regulator, partial [Vibrio fortis]
GKRITAQYTHDLHSHQRGELYPVAAFNLPKSDQETFCEFLKQLCIKHRGGTLYIHETEVLMSQQWEWFKQVKSTLLHENECNPNATCIIIASTTVPATIKGEFRQFELLPLVKRPEDIGSLFKHFARGAASRYQLPPPIITKQDVERLVAKPWPENLRQLRQEAELRVLTQAKQPEDQEQDKSNEDERAPDTTIKQLSLSER